MSRRALISRSTRRQFYRIFEEDEQGSLLLDLFPTGAVFAGGFRLLRSDYTGPLIQVERAGQVPIDIGASGLLLDIAAIIAYGAGNQVRLRRMYNQVDSPEIAFLEKTTIANQNTIANAGVPDSVIVLDGDGNVACQADGTSNTAGLAIAGLTNTAGPNIVPFCVFQRDGSINFLNTVYRIDATFTGGGNDAAFHRGDNNVNVDGSAFGSTNEIPVNTALGLPNVAYLIPDGVAQTSTIAFRTNASVTNSVAGTTNDTVTQYLDLIYGANSIAANGSRNWEGKLGNFAIYNMTPSMDVDAIADLLF